MQRPYIPLVPDGKRSVRLSSEAAEAACLIVAWSDHGIIVKIFANVRTNDFSGYSVSRYKVLISPAPAVV